jgi:hypothetical protein
MVEDIEKTPVRPKRRRSKGLYFTSKKNRFRLSGGKRMEKKEKKIILKATKKCSK